MSREKKDKPRDPIDVVDAFIDKLIDLAGVFIEKRLSKLADGIERRILGERDEGD